jgi:hypothetical protein
VTPPRQPHLYLGEDGRLRMMIEETTLFGQITMAMLNGWKAGNLRTLSNHLTVSAEWWRRATLYTRSEVIGQLVDMLWMSAAQQRLMMVAVGRVRLSLDVPSENAPVTMFPVVTERTELPSDMERAVLSLRAYAMSPAATDVNM